MKKIATSAGLLFSLTGCEIATLPEFARYDGHATTSIDVEIHAIAMPAEGVEAVEIEIRNVLLHRAEDDVWIIVGPESLTIELSSRASELVIEGVPIDQARYDLVSVEIERVRVDTQGAWQTAKLAVEVFELDIDLGDASAVQMELGFDLEASLTGTEAGGWTFDPAVTLEVLH